MASFKEITASNSCPAIKGGIMGIETRVIHLICGLLPRIFNESAGSRDDTERQKLNVEGAEKGLRSQSKDIALCVLWIFSATSMLGFPFSV
jgi:hypothetical protein